MTTVYRFAAAQVLRERRHVHEFGEVATVEECRAAHAAGCKLDQDIVAADIFEGARALQERGRKFLTRS